MVVYDPSFLKVTLRILLLGLALQESLFSSRLHSKFSKIPGYGTTFSAPQSGSQTGYAALHDLPDPLRAQALTAFADALAVSFFWTAKYQV